MRSSSRLDSMDHPFVLAKHAATPYWPSRIDLPDGNEKFDANILMLLSHFSVVSSAALLRGAALPEFACAEASRRLSLSG
jgi:hypothetical protein